MVIKLLLLLILVSPILAHFFNFFFSNGSNKKMNYGRIAKLIAFSLPFSISSGLLLYFFYGNHTFNLLVFEGVGLSVRIDSLSLIMFSMVSLIAAIVYNFSIRYMQGDEKFPRFTRLFSLIAGTVLIFTLSGNLLTIMFSWIFTSVGLQKLLVLYPERVKAVRASKTKFVLARFADVALLSSFILIYATTHTADLATLFYEKNALFQAQNHNMLLVVTLLLVLTAALKSVQFPFHTWLMGVLETPTPVSALLHAGLLNAGPFLIIRFSPLFAESANSLSALMLIGGISAIFGSLVYITQSSLKSGLVYSSIGHMGFSLMLCGFGLFSAALLHLVSHSFYKAYTFLRSGSAIEDYKKMDLSSYKRTGNVLKIVLALFATVLGYLGINYLFVNLIHLSQSLLYVSYIIFLGVFAFNVYSMDSKNFITTIINTYLFSMLIIVLFYFWETVIGSSVHGIVPTVDKISLVQQYIFYALFAGFSFNIMIQLIITIPALSKFANGLRIHIRNGLYIDSIYSRIFN